MDDFDDWIEVKKGVHSEGKRPTISEGEVWWCAVGKNVGIEINGKSERFSRPVLIFKKLSKLGFLGVPLTSQNKVGPGTQVSSFKGKERLPPYAKLR